MTIILVHPFDLGRLVTKSIINSLPIHSGIGSGLNDPALASLHTVDLSQTTLLRINLLTESIILGKNHGHNSMLIIESLPGWPARWLSWTCYIIAIRRGLKSGTKMRFYQTLQILSTATEKSPILTFSLLKKSSGNLFSRGLTESRARCQSFLMLHPVPKVFAYQIHQTILFSPLALRQ